MYDTIHSYLRQDSVDSVHLLSEIPVHLDNYTKHLNKHGLSYSGNVENLKITVTERGISIKGSIAKYYLGNNLETLTREGTKKAVSKLSEHLSLDIKQAKISRLDVGNNFEMRYKPETYFQYLGECQYFTRNTYSSSLYYTNKKREKAFYDKPLEMKSKRQPIPSELKDKNILRYETRYKRNLTRQLKVPELTYHTLYSESFYSAMLNRYRDSFKAIHKIKPFNMDLENMGKPNDFINQMALKMIDSLGDQAVESLIEELRQRDVLDRPEYYSRIKSDIRNKRAKYNTSKDDCDNLLKELEDKVNEIEAL